MLDGFNSRVGGGVLPTGPPEHRVVEEGELHLRVVLQRGPASGGRYVDVGDEERNLHGQEGLGRVTNLKTTLKKTTARVLILIPQTARKK